MGPAQVPTATSQAPLKRKRYTAEEKDALEKEKALKKQKREEEKAGKLAEKLAEKLAKDKKREEKEAERREKEAEKRKKEEEERKAKEKKERAQPKLNAFFTAKGPGTPKKGGDTTARLLTPQKPILALASPKKCTEQPVQSEYEKRFQPFFVKEYVRLATNCFAVDEDTKAAKSKVLDEYISGTRSHDINAKPFDPVEIFQLPAKPRRRGRMHVPVKHIMDKFNALSKLPEYSSIDGQTRLRRQTQDSLRKVPMKILSFREDVRPPYRGTVTLKPFLATQAKVKKVARYPMAKILPLNYDYDSEAEWQDDDGEDLDNADDEDDEDDEDDMDGFLDDSEDAGLSRRVFTNGMEPESTGICWEDRTRKGPVDKTYKYRMEFILGQ